MITYLFYILFIVIYIFFIPGYLIAKKYTHKTDRLTHFTLSISLSITIIPVISFILALVFRTYVSQLIIILAATIINLIFIGNLIVKPKKEKHLLILKKEYVFVILMGLLIFLLYFSIYEGPATGYWDTYITAPAMLITNTPIKFTDLSGNSLYEYNLPARLPGNLIQKDSFGIITKDQRLGAAIFFSVPFSFFGMIGFKIFYALAFAITFLLIFIIGKRIFNNYFLSLLLAISVVLNPLTLSITHLNANAIALMLISLLFYLIFANKSWVLIGTVYSILGGIRYVALIFSLPILFWLFTRKKHIRTNLFKFIIAAMIFISPFLYWNYFAFGNILAHPTQ